MNVWRVRTLEKLQVYNTANSWCVRNRWRTQSDLQQYFPYLGIPYRLCLLAGATCWFVADKGAALVWHYQLLLWQQILVAVAPGTLTLFLPKTRELANWTVGCMDIPTANAVLAAKGNARVNTGARPATTGSAPKRPLPGKSGSSCPGRRNKQPTAPVAPAPAEKQMKTLVLRTTRSPSPSASRKTAS